jgi:hypothetical protein
VLSGGQKKKKSGDFGRINFAIRFQGQEGASIPAYTPNSEMIGVLNIDVRERIAVKEIELELVWETEGKGDRNREVVDRDVIFVTEITPDNPVKHPFQFDLPDMPWSYQGELIQVVWKLRIKVDVDAAIDLFGMRDIKHEEPFILRP